MKTAVLLWRSDSGSIPERSRASHEASRSSRCCGSIARASRGLIRKKSASKSGASYRNPPLRTCPVASGATSQPRSSGNGEMASTPSRTSRHRSSGELTPPGSRQLMPTIATRSSSGAWPCTGPAVSGASVASSSVRWRRSAAGVGWS
ncbi:hypothetical protein SALBM135S_09608 [Streptomyces alboniger]